jgi:hypothetical protein
MLALTDPKRNYDAAKYIGRELMESFRANFVCPAGVEVTAHTSKDSGVIQNLYVIGYMRTFMLCMHAYLTVMSPLDFQGKNCSSGPNLMIQIRHERKSESVLWQSFCQATAQRIENRNLLSPLWLREGSDPSGSPGRLP